MKWAKGHQGTAATSILEQATSTDFVLDIGDDHTDEDLCAAVPADQWTVKVGMGVSSARFSLPTPADVQQLVYDTAHVGDA